MSLKLTHPCSRTWDSLEADGSDDRTRHCDSCDVAVLNVEVMSPPELEEVKARTRKGRVCLYVTRAAATLLAFGSMLGCQESASTPPPPTDPEPEDAADIEITQELLEQLSQLGGYGFASVGGFDASEE